MFSLSFRTRILRRLLLLLSGVAAVSITATILLALTPGTRDRTADIAR